MKAMDATRLAKSFSSRRGTVDAVRDITFSVDVGERVACIGPNGAGKSTTIKMLTGVLYPTAGDATVLGYTPWRQRRALAGRIGVLFGQRSQLPYELPSRDGLRLLGSIYGLDAKATARRIDELSALLKIRDLLSEPARNLSLGQRMRCELAASFIHEPELLFLDEPTIGLDLLAKQRFRELLVDLNEQTNTTVLLTSHDIADVEAVAHRVIVINHGTIIVDDDITSLRSSLLSTKVVEIHFEHPPEAIELPGVEVIVNSPTRLELHVDTTQQSIREVMDYLLRRGHALDISVIGPPLEELIGRIYRQAKR